MARRRHGRRQRNDKITGVLLGLTGVFLLGGLLTVWWWANSLPRPDTVTNCLPTGPSGVHLIVVDRSDPVSGQQAQRVRQVLNGFRDSAAVGTRFDVYTFEGNSSDQLDPVLRVCVPPKPEDANELWENPKIIRKNYEVKFAAEMQNVMDGLLAASERPTSPILESLRAAALSSLGEAPKGVPIKLTLVSDMIQHSDALSQFRSDMSFAQLSNSAIWPQLRAQLHGAETKILYVMRPSAMRGSRPIQSRGHQVFWEQVIGASGGELLSIEPI